MEFSLPLQPRAHFMCLWMWLLKQAALGLLLQAHWLINRFGCQHQINRPVFFSRIRTAKSTEPIEVSFNRWHFLSFVQSNFSDTVSVTTSQSNAFSVQRFEICERIAHMREFICWKKWPILWKYSKFQWMKSKKDTKTCLIKNLFYD